MIEILYRLVGLYFFYKTAHWNSKGDDFYQNHLLFQKLYEDFDDNMDDLAELLKALEIQESFNSKEILTSSAEYSAESKDFQSDISEAIKLTEELRKVLQEIDPTATDLGLYNFVSQLSQDQLHKLYLLKSNDE